MTMETAKGRRMRASVSSKRPPKVSHLSENRMILGHFVFAALIFLAAAYPFVLPYVYLIFALVALPMRFVDYMFLQPRKKFFLLDFCYWVNLLTCIFLIIPPAFRDPHIEASLYALADGPVSFALIYWQNAWVMSSQEHYISVLVHLLPGLAMYAHRHLPRLSSWSQIAECAPLFKHASTALDFTSCVLLQAPQPAELTMSKHWVTTTCVWLVLVPMVFYMAWQLLYWFMVQIVFKEYIRKTDCDTSFKCLARRAVRSNSTIGRIVLAGSVNRRVFMFGFFQSLYTFGTLLIFSPTYFSWHLALVYQTAKFIFPLYFGAKHVCSNLIMRAISEGIRARRGENGSVMSQASSCDTTDVTGPDLTSIQEEKKHA
jgi:hypothetical protein